MTGKLMIRNIFFYKLSIHKNIWFWITFAKGKKKKCLWHPAHACMIHDLAIHLQPTNGQANFCIEIAIWRDMNITFWLQTTSISFCPYLCCCSACLSFLTDVFQNHKSFEQHNQCKYQRGLLNMKYWYIYMYEGYLGSKNSCIPVIYQIQHFHSWSETCKL